MFSSTDRFEFCGSNKEGVFKDNAMQIVYNTTISAPHMHALTLEIMKEKLKQGKKGLDIGTGSGYMTLAMAKVMENTYI